MGERNPRISFVVPVYNTEKYLEACMNSIIDQEYQDYEVILVDDGSKDGSGAICDAFSEKYANIKTVHQQNGGPSQARNTGIENAAGDYVLFVDSDDFIEKGSLGRIAETVNTHPEGVDVVFLEACKYFPDQSVESLGDGYVGECIEGKTKRQVLEHIAQLPKFPGSPCTKLIRRQCIVDNAIYFPKGMLTEDIDWVTSLLIHAEHFAYYDGPYYYYRQSRTGSITNSVNIKHFRSLLCIIEKWSSREESGQEYQDVINSFMAYEYLMLLLTFASISREDRKRYAGRVRSLKWLLGWKKGMKYRAASLLVNIFGVSFVSKLLKLYIRLR